MANAEKDAVIADMAEKFRTSTAAVLTEYRGLSVPQITELRKALGESASYTVAKNTLVKNYLYLAEQAGAEIIPMTTVDTVRPRSGDGYVVESHRSGRRWSRSCRRRSARRSKPRP